MKIRITDKNDEHCGCEFDGLVSLYIKNREVRNHLADGKSRVIGEMTSAILNAVEWPTNGESLSVTIKKE